MKRKNSESKHLAKHKAFKINIPFNEDAPSTAKKLICFLDKQLDCKY